MKAEIEKSDIIDILWLQKAFEDVLYVETQRRALETKDIKKEDCSYFTTEFYTDNTLKICVNYCIGMKRKANGKKQPNIMGTEEYKLSEVLQICMKKSP